MQVNSPQPFKCQLHKMVKHTQTIRRLMPTNCFSVFDHFVGLALKKLTSTSLIFMEQLYLITLPKTVTQIMHIYFIKQAMCKILAHKSPYQAEIPTKQIHAQSQLQKHWKKMKYVQNTHQTNTCSKSTIETLEKNEICSKLTM